MARFTYEVSYYWADGKEDLLNRRTYGSDKEAIEKELTKCTEANSYKPIVRKLTIWRKLPSNAKKDWKKVFEICLQKPKNVI